MSQIATKEYWVECVDCGSVYRPGPQSPAWWRARQAEEVGRGAYVDSKMCGCSQEKKAISPNAPYRVFGYDMLCEDFDYPFFRFTEACKTFKKLNVGPDVVFITGISNTVLERLKYV
jgi:hypothetical protein